MQKLQGHKELRKFYTTDIKMDKWMAHLEIIPACGYRRWIELGQICKGIITAFDIINCNAMPYIIPHLWLAYS